MLSMKLMPVVAKLAMRMAHLRLDLTRRALLPVLGGRVGNGRRHPVALWREHTVAVPEDIERPSNGGVSI